MISGFSGKGDAVGIWWFRLELRRKWAVLMVVVPNLFVKGGIGKPREH